MAGSERGYRLQNGACCLQLKTVGAYMTDVGVLSAVLHLFCGPWGNTDEVGDSFE